MKSDLVLEVHWTTGRTVTVRVHVEEAIGDVEEATRRIEAFGKEPVFAIDFDVLGSREELIAYLKRITFAEADGGIVRAVVLEPDVPTLLELLGGSGPPSGPIRVEVS